MNLSSGKQKELLEALISAFPTRPELTQWVRFNLNKNLEAIVEPGTLEHIVFQLIQQAEAKGEIDHLIHEAYKERPNNPELRAFVEQYKKALQKAALQAEERKKAEQLAREQAEARRKAEQLAHEQAEAEDAKRRAPAPVNIDHLGLAPAVPKDPEQQTQKEIEPPSAPPPIFPAVPPIPRTPPPVFPDGFMFDTDVVDSGSYGVRIREWGRNHLVVVIQWGRNHLVVILGAAGIALVVMLMLGGVTVSPITQTPVPTVASALTSPSTPVPIVQPTPGLPDVSSLLMLGPTVIPVDQQWIDQALTTTINLRSYHFSLKIGKDTDPEDNRLDMEGDYVAPDKMYFKGNDAGTLGEWRKIGTQVYSKAADGSWQPSTMAWNPVDSLTKERPVLGHGSVWQDLGSETTVDGRELDHFLQQFNTADQVNVVEMWRDRKTKYLYRMMISSEDLPNYSGLSALLHPGTPIPTMPASSNDSLYDQYDLTISRPSDPSIRIPSP